MRLVRSLCRQTCREQPAGTNDGRCGVRLAKGTAFAGVSAMAKTRKRTPDAGRHEPIAQGVDEASTSVSEPDQIARRAYQLYQARGGSDGGALDDWLAAEQELNRHGRDD